MMAHQIDVVIFVTLLHARMRGFMWYIRKTRVFQLHGMTESSEHPESILLLLMPMTI